MKVRSKKELNRVLSWVLNNRVEIFTITIDGHKSEVKFVNISGGGHELALDNRMYEKEVIDYLWNNKNAFYSAMPAEWIELALENR